LIKGIIFDLGHTLIRFTGDWDEVSRDGVEAMARWYLKKKHIKLDGQALGEAFIAERLAARETAAQTQMEVTAQESLQAALKKVEASAAAMNLVETAVKVFFEPEERAWQSYPDTVDTLKVLKSRNYRLGLYSNATDDPFVQRTVNRNSLRPWLAPTFSSAGWGWRKPRPEAFELIARRWGLPASEIVVVGDTLKADVSGAQACGMYSVLVTMDEAPSNAQHRHIQPTATAESLAALPDIMARLG
jgi:HAD superfamily hydrolase (TIGR01549 family)